MSSQYIETYKPVAAYNIETRIIDQFAAGLEGRIVRYNRTRSRIDIHNSAESFTYQCQVVRAKCPVCGDVFYDITFLDNDGSATGCDCGAGLEY